MDLSKLNKNQFALVVSERNTGIVLNPHTFKRWTEQSGGEDYMQADSLEAAKIIAAGVLSGREGIEVMILNHNGDFMERIS